MKILYFILKIIFFFQVFIFILLNFSLFSSSCSIQNCRYVMPTFSKIINYPWIYIFYVLIIIFWTKQIIYEFTILLFIRFFFLTEFFCQYIWFDFACTQIVPELGLALHDQPKILVSKSTKNKIIKKLRIVDICKFDKTRLIVQCLVLTSEI